MPVRLKDIAKELNVSIVTVSKVLRGHSDISLRLWGPSAPSCQGTELSSKPGCARPSNRQDLHGGSPCPRPSAPLLRRDRCECQPSNPPQGLQHLIISSEEDPKLEIDGIESLLAHQVDGLILASTLTEAQRDIFWRIEQQKIPYVLVDRKISGLHANFVGVDDEEIGILATEHLIQQGKRRIAHISGPKRLSPGLGAPRDTWTPLRVMG